LGAVRIALLPNPVAERAQSKFLVTLTGTVPCAPDCLRCGRRALAFPQRKYLAPPSQPAGPFSLSKSPQTEPQDRWIAVEFIARFFCLLPLLLPIGPISAATASVCPDRRPVQSDPQSAPARAAPTDSRAAQGAGRESAFFGHTPSAPRHLRRSQPDPDKTFTARLDAAEITLRGQATSKRYRRVSQVDLPRGSR
jgi:hypothetical protein